MLRAIGLAFLLVGIAFYICVGQSTGQDRVPATPGRATQMNDCAANKAMVGKLFDEWINKKNLSAIDEMVTPNYVSHESGEDTKAEYAKKFLAGVFAGVSQRRFLGSFHESSTPTIKPPCNQVPEHG